MTKVKIKQFKNKAKEPIAGLTPEHAIYDKNGVRLDAKLGNVNLQEFRDLQQQCVNNINAKVVEAETEIDAKYEEVSQFTQASMIGANTVGLEGTNVQENLNNVSDKINNLKTQTALILGVQNFKSINVVANEWHTIATNINVNKGTLILTATNNGTFTSYIGIYNEEKRLVNLSVNPNSTGNISTELSENYNNLQIRINCTSHTNDMDIKLQYPSVLGLDDLTTQITNETQRAKDAESLKEDRSNKTSELPSLLSNAITYPSSKAVAASIIPLKTIVDSTISYGNNLFSNLIEERKHLSNTTGVTVDDNDWAVSSLIPIVGGEYYSFKFIDTTNKIVEPICTWVWYDKNLNIIPGEYAKFINKQAPDNAVYIRLSINEFGAVNYKSVFGLHSYVDTLSKDTYEPFRTIINDIKENPLIVRAGEIQPFIYNSDTLTFDATISKQIKLEYKGIQHYLDGNISISKVKSLVFDTILESIVIKDTLTYTDIILLSSGEIDNDWRTNIHGPLVSMIVNPRLISVTKSGILKPLIKIDTVEHPKSFKYGFYFSDASIVLTIVDRTKIINKNLTFSVYNDYYISENSALVYNYCLDTIEVIPNDKIKDYHVVLLSVGMYTSYSINDTIDGIFKDMLVLPRYEIYEKEHVRSSYEREVDNISIECISKEYDFSALINTDIHTSTQSEAFQCPVLNVVNRVHRNINTDIVVNLGDTVSLGLEDNHRAYYSLNDLVNHTEERSNAFFVVGNHDYNNISELSVDRQPKESILSKKALYNILGRNHASDVVWGSRSGMYYYKDFDDKKIRMIVLNTLDKPEEFITIDGKEYEKYPWLPNIVSSAQVDWFIDTALNLQNKSDKEEWSVLILSHVTPVPNAVGNEASIGSINSDNLQGIELCKIATAFINGTSATIDFTDTLYGGASTLNRTCDFTTQGAIPIIGWFSGHTHIDNLITYNGVTYITTQCGDVSAGLEQQKNPAPMERATLSELCMDVLLLNKTEGTVLLKRYGAGKDRSYNYTGKSFSTTKNYVLGNYTTNKLIEGISLKRGMTVTLEGTYKTTPEDSWWLQLSTNEGNKINIAQTGSQTNVSKSFIVDTDYDNCTVQLIGTANGGPISVKLNIN